MLPAQAVDSLPRVAVSPSLGATLLGCVALGVCLGTVSGLTPGLHVNSVALSLVSLAALFPSPLAAGTTMLAAGVVHTFLDVVPSLALGVPDAAMAPATLPGHRLVLAGRGREALRLSALGSAGAVALAVPLAVPVSLVARAWYPVLRASLPFVLCAVVAALLLTERSTRAALGGVASFVVSAALGAATLPLTPTPPFGLGVPGSLLAPLLAGLFGAPILLTAAGGDGLPPQDAATTRAPRRLLARTVAAGTTAGALVGYLPGVSAGVASALALPAVGHPRGDLDAARAYVITTSGANTSNALFAK